MRASAPVSNVRTVDQADPRRSNRIRFRVTRHICVKNIVHRTLHVVRRPSRGVSAHVQVRGTEAVGVQVVDEAGPRARHEMGKRSVAWRFPQEGGDASQGRSEAVSVEVVKHKGDFRHMRDSKVVRNAGGNGVESIRVHRHSRSRPGFASQPSRCNEHGISNIFGHPTVLESKDRRHRRNFGRNPVGRVVGVGCGNLFRQEWFKWNARCLCRVCTKESAKCRAGSAQAQGQVRGSFSLWSPRLSTAKSETWEFRLE